jgi:Hypothetical protein (DUF2513)
MQPALVEDILPPPSTRGDDMQRSMDLIRELLLQIDKNPQFDGTCQIQPETPADLGITDHSYEEVAYNLNQLVDAGFVKGARTMQMPIISQLTWSGHDFADSVRDQETWAKTKNAAAGAGGFTVDLLKDLAKGFIKKQIEEKTGIKL